ncbi:hypothetical protein CEXT_451831 [Caerostris extrusa]|uniref:Uncharacterized protein n=1 Tax=Caerostris extrusa TaxID=172846 RepID=A0AAV4P6B3_CAEEX|nr:hypothetical protein CEXT_451831 [Caerostris extrusa]
MEIKIKSAPVDTPQTPGRDPPAQKQPKVTRVITEDGARHTSGRLCRLARGCRLHLRAKVGATFWCLLREARRIRKGGGLLTGVVLSEP